MSDLEVCFYIFLAWANGVFFGWIRWRKSYLDGYEEGYDKGYVLGWNDANDEFADSAQEQK